MVSPLVLVFANIFLFFLESKWLNAYNPNKPKFYLRYVDHILVEKKCIWKETRFIKIFKLFKQ